MNEQTEANSKANEVAEWARSQGFEVAVTDDGDEVFVMFLSRSVSFGCILDMMAEADMPAPDADGMASYKGGRYFAVTYLHPEVSEALVKLNDAWTEPQTMSQRWGVSDPDDAALVDAWEAEVDGWLETYTALVSPSEDGQYNPLSNMTDEQCSIIRTDRLDFAADLISPYLTRQANKWARARATDLMNECIRKGFAVKWLGTASFEVSLTTRLVQRTEVNYALRNDDLPLYRLGLTGRGVLVVAL